MADSVGTQMGNIDGENFRMNYINVNHLVRLYDVSRVRQAVGAKVGPLLSD